MTARLRKVAPAFALLAWGGLFASPGSAQTPLAPEAVERSDLARDAFSTGTLTAGEGALARDLWNGAEPQTLSFLLERLPSRPASPSLGEAMRRLLLSPGDAPDGAGPELGARKLLALSRAGFVEEAAAIASLSSVSRGDPYTGRAEAIADLLKGESDRACSRSQRLASGQDQPFWVKLRVYCYVRANERDAADLTLGILRETGTLSQSEDALLTAFVAGSAPKEPVAPKSPLEYAVTREFGYEISPAMASEASGAVLKAIIADPEAGDAARIAAAKQAVARGVAPAGALIDALAGVALSVEAVANADAALNAAPASARTPLDDAALYQSIETMAAPEFARDRAARLAAILNASRAPSERFAWSQVFSNEISALEGILVSPSEARAFALAMMATGQADAAGRWLEAATGTSGAVSALAQSEAMAFIDLVNLYARLEPQRAARLARAADVSLIGASAAAPGEDGSLSHALAPVLEAAFDAALGDKKGQAGLAALAAAGDDALARGVDAEGARAVLVSQSLRAAGLDDLRRRYEFERALAARFAGDDDLATEDADGFGPRVKPGSN